jgi:cob(I)alamin adenosyltransferase
MARKGESTAYLINMSKKMVEGLIHVYTGDGKGKTTAAIGLALRSAGQGKRVLILQFLKSSVKDSGEVIAAKKSGIKFITFKGQTHPLFDPHVNLSELKRAVRDSIKASLEKISSTNYDLLVMDEFITLLSDGLATSEDIQKIMKAKPKGLELVFTGRGAPEELINMADYVTEIRMIKHPFTKGIKARRGIEF